MLYYTEMFLVVQLAWAILEICLSSFWLCMCYAYGDLGASSPREILIFRRSETTSSAFSGMMNSIWEKLHYAYSQNNIQHILTCKSIMNPKCYILVLVFCKPGLPNRKATQLLAHLHQIKWLINVSAFMYAPPT